MRSMDLMSTWYVPLAIVPVAFPWEVHLQSDHISSSWPVDERNKIHIRDDQSSKISSFISRITFLLSLHLCPAVWVNFTSISNQLLCSHLSTRFQVKKRKNYSSTFDRFKRTRQNEIGFGQWTVTREREREREWMASNFTGNKLREREDTLNFARWTEWSL